MCAEGLVHGWGRRNNSIIEHVPAYCRRRGSDACLLAVKCGPKLAVLDQRADTVLLGLKNKHQKIPAAFARRGEVFSSGVQPAMVKPPDPHALTPSRPSVCAQAHARKRQASRLKPPVV